MLSSKSRTGWLLLLVLALGASLPLAASGQTRVIRPTPDDDERPELYTFSVTRYSPTASTVYAEKGTTIELRFKVTNGNRTARVDLSTGCAGLTCTMNVTSPFRLYANATRYVTLSVDVGQQDFSSVTLNATAEDYYGEDFLGSGSASYQIDTRPEYGVEVTATAGLAVATQGATNQSFTYTVKNIGRRSDRYRVRCDTEGAATCVSSAESYLPWLGNNQSTTVTVQANMGTGGSGADVGLLVRSLYDTAVQEEAWTHLELNTVSTQFPAAFKVELEEQDPGGSFDRSGCLTVAAGGFDIQCGDLRYVHTFPAFTTLNRTRSVRLIYNSGLARARAVVAANVTIPTGSGTPTRLKARLKLDGAIVDAVEYSGSELSPLRGATVRPVLVHEDEGLETGLYPIEVFVELWAGGSYLTETKYDTIAVVNWSDSEVGAGWNHSFGERLLAGQPNNALLWVGADGSTQVYDKVRSSPAKWLARRPGPADSVRVGGVGYIRYLPGGGTVDYYSVSGRLKEITDPTGNSVVVNYREYYGKLVPFQILRPRSPTGHWQTDGFYYQYTTSGPSLWMVKHREDGVPNPLKYRMSYISHSGSQVSRIQDPMGHRTEFGYGTNGLLDTLTTPRGAVNTVSYEIDAVTHDPLKVLGVTTKASPSGGSLAGPPRVTTNYRPFSTAGRNSVVTVENAYAIVDGPRTDSLDVSRFWLTPFHAVQRIRDAYGNETESTRGDARNPRLVTEVRYPNGGRMTASYDALGRLEESVDHSIPGTARNRFDWDDKWHKVTWTETPEGRVYRAGYDPNNGNRKWEQWGDDDSRKVSYTYNGNNQALLDSVKLGPLNGDTTLTSFTYDGNGNLKEVWEGGERVTSHTRDFMGRITNTESLAGNNGSRYGSVTYDRLDRPTLQVSYSDLDDHRLSVATEYDPTTGDRLKVERWATPDPNDIGTLTTTWEYDGLGRVRREIAGDGEDDVYEYDAAGNLIEHFTRRGERITMAYDRMGRLRTKTLPAHGETLDIESQNFAGVGYPKRTVYLPQEVYAYEYDVMGNMIRADNKAAQVRRAYDQAGRLVTDSLRINSYDPGSYSSYPTSPTWKTFVTSYKYDKEGRREQMVRPTQLSTGNDVEYEYDATTGALRWVREGDTQHFEFIHDRFGRLERLNRPGNLQEIRSYDGRGRLKLREITSPKSGWSVGEGRPRLGRTVMNDALQYLDDGRIRRVDDLLGYQTMGYSGLGHRTQMNAYEFNDWGQGVPWLEEYYRYDALGNAQVSRTWTDNSGSGVKGADYDNDTESYYKNNGTGRLDFEETSTTYAVAFEGTAGEDGAYGVYGWTTGDSYMGEGRSYLYDAAGNRTVTSYTGPWSPDPYVDPSFGVGRRARALTQLVYGPEGRLQAVDRKVCPIDGSGGCIPEWYKGEGGPGVFERHRYDALGRRVMTYSRANDTQCITLGCPNALTRFVWDGDQIAGEIRYNTKQLKVRDERWDSEAPWIPVNLEQESGALDLRRYMFWDSFYTEGPNTKPWRPNDEDVDAWEEAGLELELKAPLFYPYGVVAYLHGPEIDQPLAIHRDYLSPDHGPITINPITNWKGDILTAQIEVRSGTNTYFKPLTCLAARATSASDRVRCQEVQWPAMRWGTSYHNFDQQVLRDGERFWMGSLVNKGRDASGLMNMRNRYYDPVSGQFTQEDPIGMAGGVNLYGYAGGDPVNFSDPFGLDCFRDGKRVPCNPTPSEGDPMLARRSDDGTTRGSDYKTRGGKHNGQDSRAGIGTRVRPMYDGTVVWVQPDNQAAGVRVYVQSDHDPEQIIGYWHLWFANVVEGQRVTTFGGPDLGRTGISGNADPTKIGGREPHLHVVEYRGEIGGPNTRNPGVVTGICTPKVQNRGPQWWWK